MATAARIPTDARSGLPVAGSPVPSSPPRPTDRAWAAAYQMAATTRTEGTINGAAA